MSTRPVWLFSLDSNRYPDAFPLACGNLKAYFSRFGATKASTDVELVHFGSHLDVPLWMVTDWTQTERARAQAAVAAGVRPTVGISCYTWNTQEFLHLVHRMKEDVPELLIIAGGPQVQGAEAYLKPGSIDIVVFGEGEITFTELLDSTFHIGASRTEGVAAIQGIGWRDDGDIQRRTPSRPRVRDLDELPSAIDVVPLRDPEGKPLYRRAAYETSRGCPFRCAFCEWGTGAIGTKMYEYSLERIRTDLRRLTEAGVDELFFCDSNFGALRSDGEKAAILVQLRAEYGRPRMFCSSWSKGHGKRVQDVVRQLHDAGLIEHYTLALETLTPEALQASNRSNLKLNRFEEIVTQMAEEGIPVTTELIWGLPGDNLADFLDNLDRITAMFPSSSLYGYTLLPGTEFYRRREEYQIATETLREVGNWTLDYVVASHSFTREEGIEGYFLITAHSVLNRGNLIPFTSRAIALDGRVSVSSLLMDTLSTLLASSTDGKPVDPATDGLRVYADRDRIYRRLLEGGRESFAVIRSAVLDALARRSSDDPSLRTLVERVLDLDQALFPGTEQTGHTEQFSFEFDARAVYDALRLMRMPPPGAVDRSEHSTLRVARPGIAADFLAPGSLAPGVVRGNHAVVP